MAKIKSVVDLGGCRGCTRPPTAQNFLNFMQFFGKFGNFLCWHPRWLVPPPMGNPGSAPQSVYN